MKRFLLFPFLLLLLGCSHAQSTDNALRTGAEVFMSNPPQDMGAVAVVGNQTSVVGCTHLVDTLLSRGVKVVKIFSPEHGFRGVAAAGEKVGDAVDGRTSLPIISLYGKNKKPSAEQMKGVSTVIFDLQDVGCRFYTYLSTLHYVMEACAESNIPLIVLDRPNPNGHYVDGPVLDTSAVRSFVGMHPVPIVYGMTIGEYATMVNGEGWLAGRERCRLQVITMLNYDRTRRDYHLPIPPSPNLRTEHAIALYPSLCLFEGTTIGVGRGTDYPFELLTTTSGTIDLRSDPTDTLINMHYLLYMYQHTPEGKFFLKGNFFDLLAGNYLLRQQIINGTSEHDIRLSWQPALNTFKKIRKNYLLYK